MTVGELIGQLLHMPKDAKVWAESYDRFTEEVEGVVQGAWPTDVEARHQKTGVCIRTLPCDSDTDVTSLY